MNALCMPHGQSEYNVLGLCHGDPAKSVGLTDERMLELAFDNCELIACEL